MHPNQLLGRNMWLGDGPEAEAEVKEEASQAVFVRVLWRKEGGRDGRSRRGDQASRYAPLHLRFMKLPSSKAKLERSSFPHCFLPQSCP
jgi:hypothetical protein